jgi:hypothetical protein
MGQSATGRSIVGGGGTVATDANSGFLLTPVLSQNSGITSFVTFRRLVAWKSKLADATLQAFTA